MEKEMYYKNVYVWISNRSIALNNFQLDINHAFRKASQVSLCVHKWWGSHLLWEPGAMRISYQVQHRSFKIENFKVSLYQRMCIPLCERKFPSSFFSSNSIDRFYTYLFIHNSNVPSICCKFQISLRSHLRNLVFSLAILYNFSSELMQIWIYMCIAEKYHGFLNWIELNWTVHRQLSSIFFSPLLWTYSLALWNIFFCSLWKLEKENDMERFV